MTMNDTVMVHYSGGPWDGRIEPVDITEFAAWVGRCPFGQFRIGSHLHLYESFVVFAVRDEVVEVHWSGIVDTVDDLDGYDGWLAPCDRYDEPEGIA